MSQTRWMLILIVTRVCSHRRRSTYPSLQRAAFDANGTKRVGPAIRMAMDASRMINKHSNRGVYWSRIEYEVCWKNEPQYRNPASH
jgi:hypothetical protein